MKESRKPMMKKISFAAFAFAIAMLIAAPVAMATTVSEVQSMITQLKGKVQIVRSTASKLRQKIVQVFSVSSTVLR
jgi:cell division protein FtsL